MEGIINCPKCQQSVNANDFFCPFCGHKIRSPPLSTKWSSLVFLAIKTLLLPPFGFWWGYKYLKQEDKKSKVIGWVVVLVTIVELVWGYVATVDMVKLAKEQINLQMVQQSELYNGL